MKPIHYFLVILGFSMSVNAQVGIGTITPAAALDIVASNTASPANTDGILIPRIDEFPLTQPNVNQNGILVFITGNGAPTQGFYFWTGATWQSIGNTGGNTLDDSYDQGGAGLGRTVNVTNGPVQLAGTANATGTPNTGLLEIGGSLRFDDNQIMTNSGTELFTQFGNNSDFSVDDTTLFVDASTNRVGIGTFMPDYRFHVEGGRGEFTGTNDATGTINSGVLEIGNSLRLDGDELITNTGTTLSLQNGNNGDLSVDGNSFYVDASTNNVGIGTNSPAHQLVVNGGRVEIQTITEATNFTNSGSLEIGNGLRLDNNEITTNNGITMYLQEESNGDVDIDDGSFLVDGSTNRTGVGITTPQRKLHVRHGTTNSDGLGISNLNGAGSQIWHFFVRSGALPRLELYYQGIFRGSFDQNSGFYTSASDRNLKKNIKPSQSNQVIEQLKQLNIVDYQFKEQTDPRIYKGFIAQEVEKIFPHLVYAPMDSDSFYSMDYTGFGIVAIQAIQEQQKIIEDLIQRIEVLENNQNTRK